MFLNIQYRFGILRESIFCKIYKKFPTRDYFISSLIENEEERKREGKKAERVGERERSRIRHEDAFSRWGVNSAALRLPLSAASSCNHQHKAPLSILLRSPTLPAHTTGLSHDSLFLSFILSPSLEHIPSLPSFRSCSCTMFLPLWESLSLRACRHCTPIE